jgi:hypothetical protein
VAAKFLAALLSHDKVKGLLSCDHFSVDGTLLEVIRTFERIGVELFAEPADGLYVWARVPGIEDSSALAERAGREGFCTCSGERIQSATRPLTLDAVQCRSLRHPECSALV